MILSLTDKIASLEKEKKQLDQVAEHLKKTTAELNEVMQERAALKLKLN